MAVASTLAYYDTTKIWLHNPLDGTTNTKHNLLHFLKANFCKQKKNLGFYWDKCCQLALFLWLILLHYGHKKFYNTVPCICCHKTFIYHIHT